MADWLATMMFAPLFLGCSLYSFVLCMPRRVVELAPFRILLQSLRLRGVQEKAFLTRAKDCQRQHPVARG